MIQQFATQYFDEQDQANRELLGSELERQLEILETAYKNDKQIIVFGNGGSASTASHFVCDLGKGASRANLRRFRVFSLNDNMAMLSAYANDVSYDDVFSEALKNYVREGDVVIGITASGNSPNILKAIDVGRESGATTLGWIGFGGGKLKDKVDSALYCSSRNYGVVECAHMILHHVVAQHFMKRVPELGIS
jgi:D-sedoheptulose 7-phosphate isomerase